MKKHHLLLALLALLVLAVPAAAQDIGPGEGGPIIWPNFGGDPTNLNPLLSSEGSSQDITNLIFPNFLKINAETGNIDPGAPDQIVDTWEISEDGLTYTFHLRDDYVWSDGTPVTSADVKYAYDAIASGEIDTTLGGYLSNVASLEAPDPQTVVVTFNTVDCTALSSIRVIPPVPAHLFTELFASFSDMNEAEFNLNPSVTSGEFNFLNFRSGEQVTLEANQDFPDAPLGYVVPQGFIQRQLANQTVIVDEFLAGNLTIIDSVPEDRQAELEALAANGDVQLYSGPSSGWQFFGFNVADPTNPQPGLDEEGNVIDQGHHPIFGDVRVRQAFALSINHDDLNTGAFAGTGIPVASPVLPYSWAYNDALEPWPYDPEAAMALLDEAGFVDDDNDPSTPRVATEDALYAEPGTPLRFTLTTFSGNTSVDSSSILMQDQLRRTGFQMELDIIEFGSMIAKFYAQTFDAIMLFFGGFDSTNPDEQKDLWTALGDIPGSGFNVGSYNNPEVTALYDEARSLPGCDTAERKAIYDRIQEILHDELPMYWVNTSVVPVVIQPDVENIDYIEGPGGLTRNITAWAYLPR